MKNHKEPVYRNDLIRAEMARQDIGVLELQNKTGLSMGAITALRKGRPVTTTTLQRVADGLGIGVQELFASKVA